MPIFMLRRSAEAFVTLFILTILIFALARLAGDPVPLVLGTEATQADIEFYRRQYGLDKSLVMQYVTFLGNISQGDFGVSFRYRVPAIDMIMPALWATFQLVSVAMLLAVAVGVPMGVLGSVQPRSLWSRMVGWYAAAGESIPSFWFALILMLVFAVSWGVLPSSGYGTWQHFVLPVCTLALFSSASLAAVRQPRTALGGLPAFSFPYVASRNVGASSPSSIKSQDSWQPWPMRRRALVWLRSSPPATLLGYTS